MKYRILKTDFASGRVEYTVQCFKQDMSGIEDPQTGAPPGDWITVSGTFSTLKDAEDLCDADEIVKNDVLVQSVQVIPFAKKV